MKRHPERTISGRLALMTEDRDHFQQKCINQYELIDKPRNETKAKDEYIVNYRRKTQFQLDWYRNHIQALVSKIPTGGRAQ